MAQTFLSIKKRLALLDKKQVDLRKALAERGVYAAQSEISNAIRDINNDPKAIEIRKTSKEILEEWESKTASQ